MTAVDPPIGDLLDRLASSAPDAAWQEFVGRYSPLIMYVVRRLESDASRATDGLQYVCAALSDNRFRRLLAYRRDGAAQFRTWLMAVVTNLCRDWQRRRHGRFRPLRSLAALPELDQLVYRCIFVRGMRRSECLHTLQGRFPDLTDRQLSEVNARLFGLLTPQQRWQLGTRTAAAGPGGEEFTLSTEDGGSDADDPGAGPEELAASAQDRNRLQAALARLPQQQRLLLRLRYEQDLTLAEVARLTRLPDPFRAKREIQAALSALAGLMDPSPASPRKKP